MQILLKKAIILCPGSKFHLKKKDVWIRNGKIEKIANTLSEKADKIINQKDLYVSTGWVDIFSDFCDPGSEQKENIESGVQVAAAGGYSDIFLIPNTTPTVNNKGAIEYLKKTSRLVNIHPLGAVSKNIEGKDLAEMYDMQQAGAIAFTDGIQSIQNSGLLMKALQYIKTFDGVLIEIPEDKNITHHGLMNEGLMSTKIGLQGKPALAEDIHTFRNIALLQYTNSRLHLTGVSTKKSIELIRQAKKQNLQITCSVTPYHLLYSDTQLEEYSSLYKVNPPLRTEEDRKALIKAIEDGTIDCIASHHSPQHWDDKEVEFAFAKNGMITLQTMLPMLLKVSDKISVEKWISLLTNQPREIFRMPKQSIAIGEKACITVFSSSKKWTFNAASNCSLSKNSPLFGEEINGKILAVINNYEYASYE